MDIEAWLGGLGLGEYAPVFRDNDIDLEVLSKLTAGDLTALGVTSIGHRRKLLTAIACFAEITTLPRVAALLPAASNSRAERRQLTVMFVDLVGSTELSQRLDPEDTREVIFAYPRARCPSRIDRTQPHCFVEVVATSGRLECAFTQPLPV
ncbi:SAM domain-containing protein [Mesorhizobium sp. dw_380]|uniref:SAM domain-containing protein n=1 Tax=Mesorhizobium sp. dw_380 TaxID=2812001 RepID=UPI001BDEAF00